MVDIGHVLSRVETALTGLVSSSDTDFPVTSTAGFVAPCAVLVGHKDAWHDPAQTYVPELVWITTVVDGTTLRCILADRGISGTAVRSHDGTTGDLVVTQVLDQRNWSRLRDELAGAARTVHDTYTGDGTRARQIPVPFTPSLVVISWTSDSVHYTARSGAKLGATVVGDRINSAPGGEAAMSTSEHVRPELGASHFVVSTDPAATDELNISGIVYDYTAFGVA